MQCFLIIHTVIVSDTLQSHFEDRNSKQIAFSTLIDAFSSVTIISYAFDILHCWWFNQMEKAILKGQGHLLLCTEK